MQNKRCLTTSGKLPSALFGRARLGEHGNAADPLLLVFASLLYKFHRDDANDPRDKIFALLVLMEANSRSVWVRRTSTEN